MSTTAETIRDAMNPGDELQAKDLEAGQVVACWWEGGA